MNRNNPTPASSSRLRQIWLRLQPFTASRAGKLAACLILGVAATLSQTARAQTPPPPGSYGAYALSNNPVAYWQLDETTTPATGTLLAHDYTGNGFNGTYLIDVYNGFDGIYAPPNPPFLGFAVNQGAALTVAGDVNSSITLPPLNLNTNAVTIAMWINPDAQQVNFTGLLFNRTSAGDVAGFGFGGTQNAAGATVLGYTWNNNNQNTWGFGSGLYPPVGTWSYVALVIQSNQATIYLDYLDPNNNNQPVLLSAVNPIAHTAEAFSSGGIFLGSDSLSATVTANNEFAGYISDAAVFKSALTSAQILQLFGAGYGLQGFKPSITTQPQSDYVLAGVTTQVKATGINGTAPFAYQWQLNNTNISGLVDSANFTGATSNVLTILNVTTNDAGSYHLIVTNVIGMTVSSNATLAVQPAALVGEWFNGSVASTNLVDVSGYSLAANHDAMVIGAGNYAFTNDVPPGKSGQSLFFFNGASGFAVSNSSTLDPDYDNTFDNAIGNAFTVACWSKGWPTTWSPWVSKFGETEAGWQLRSYGGGPDSCFTLRGAGGTATLGISGDDMGTTTIPSNDGSWHLYVGTYDASTGIRNLYVDSKLAASQTNNVTYTLAAVEHLCIGAKDSPPGSTYGNYSTMEVFDARVYNYALSASQVQGIYGTVPAAVDGQPNAVAGFTGTAANFQATAAGTLPLSYQWLLNGTNVNLLPDSTNFSGLNSNVLTVLSLTTNDGGSYQVIVTNLYGHATSSIAILTIVPRTLVGEWFTNGTLTDLSGFTPAGTHDGYAVGAGLYYFTNDVPLGESGQSIRFPASASAIAISNSSTADGATYTNTYAASEFTVAFWAKDRGPGGAPWIAWVSKDGYNNDSEYDGLGWSVGIEAWSQHLYYDLDGIDNGATVYTLGDGLWGNTVMESSPQALPANSSTWHHYAATYSPVTRMRNLYMDGVLVGQQTNLISSYALAANKHLMIGGQEQTTAGFTGFARAYIYDVRYYNYSLSSTQVVALLPNPVITVQPAQSISAYKGVTFKISATVTTFNKATTYQWQLNDTNLVDGAYGGGYIVGSATNVLTIEDTTTNFQGVYNLVITYSGGTAVSSNSTVTVSQTAAISAGNVVGAWLTGAANLTDTSGYSPAGTHDGYGAAGASDAASSNYRFTNDVPPGATGNSLLLYAGSTAIAISNSSTVDANYTNTFDNTISNTFSVVFWAKGAPGAWTSMVSKDSEGDPGAWAIRGGNGNGVPCFTVKDNGAGSVSVGYEPYGNDDNCANNTVDSNWHFYSGTFNASSGIRNLYIDGSLVAQETNNVAYNMTPNVHLTIGSTERPASNGSPGIGYNGYYTGNIYGVQIYNTELSVAQVNGLIPPVPLTTASPVVNKPVLNGNHQVVFTWTGSSLLEATNILGPWTPVAGATSPYTNNITTYPQLFFKAIQ